MSLTSEILAQQPDNVLERLRRSDRFWSALREGKLDAPEVVSNNTANIGQTDTDIVICGGTLGILLGAALQQRGWSVTLIERGILRGREQEWNISRNELQTFVDLELLTEAELQKAIASLTQSFEGELVQLDNMDNILDDSFEDDELPQVVDIATLLERPDIAEYTDEW